MRKLKANWVIGLENGKLACITIDVANPKSLREREGYRATLTNIPSIVQETLLLRSLWQTGAKVVFILYNSNRNPSHTAKVFFESQEEIDYAVKRNIYYYNTRLFWKKDENTNTG